MLRQSRGRIAAAVLAAVLVGGGVYASLDTWWHDDERALTEPLTSQAPRAGEGDALELSTWDASPAGGFDRALQGVLAVNESGCAYLKTPLGPPLDLVWPPGYSAWSDSGEVHVFTEAGRLVATVGDSIEFEGTTFRPGDRVETFYRPNVVCRAAPGRGKPIGLITYTDGDPR